MESKWLLTHDFASLAGVTVRTLHHYDRLGLLKPRRSRSGYRVYTDGDLHRLEQIVALKFIGIPLKDIARLLERDSPDFLSTLRTQRKALEEKKRLLESAIAAIQEAESVIAAHNSASAPVLQKIIEVIEMQNKSDWALQYYTEAAREKLEANRARWTPELQVQAEKDWSDLLRDARLAADQDPAGPVVQALLDRRNALIQQFTAGDPEVTAGLNRFYADSANWPAEFQQQMQPFSDPVARSVFERAEAARRGN